MKELEVLLNGKYTPGEVVKEIMGNWKYRLALEAFWFLKVPSPIKREIKKVASYYDITVLNALILNLSYELFGAACISGAFPSKYDDEWDDRYRVFRQLEWAVPEPCRSEPVKYGDLYTMRITATSGIYDGMAENTVITINLPPDYFDQPANFIWGTPASWLVRQALMSPDPEYTLLKSGPVCRAAWCLVAKPYNACIVHLCTDGNHKIIRHANYPEVLVIGNDWAFPGDQEHALRKWIKRRVAHEERPLEPATKLPEIITNRSGILHSVCYSFEGFYC